MLLYRVSRRSRWGPENPNCSRVSTSENLASERPFQRRNVLPRQQAVRQVFQYATGLIQHGPRSASWPVSGWTNAIRSGMGGRCPLPPARSCDQDGPITRRGVPERAAMRHARWQADDRRTSTGPRTLASPWTLALADIATADRSARRSASTPVPEVRWRPGCGGAVRRLRSRTRRSRRTKPRRGRAPSCPFPCLEVAEIHTSGATPPTALASQGADPPASRPVELYEISERVSPTGRPVPVRPS